MRQKEEHKHGMGSIWPLADRLRQHRLQQCRYRVNFGGPKG